MALSITFRLKNCGLNIFILLLLWFYDLNFVEIKLFLETNIINSFPLRSNFEFVVMELLLVNLNAWFRVIRLFIGCLFLIWKVFDTTSTKSMVLLTFLIFIFVRLLWGKGSLIAMSWSVRLVNISTLLIELRLLKQSMWLETDNRHLSLSFHSENIILWKTSFWSLAFVNCTRNFNVLLCFQLCIRLFSHEVVIWAVDLLNTVCSFLWRILFLTCAPKHLTFCLAFDKLNILIYLTNILNVSILFQIDLIFSFIWRLNSFFLNVVENNIRGE